MDGDFTQDTVALGKREKRGKNSAAEDLSNLILVRKAWNEFCTPV
jgi:hypothetical protein